MRLSNLDKLQKDLQQGRSDPVYFSENLLGVTPHKKQKEWLRNSQEKINCLVPGNRFGKTLITAVNHIWMNFYKIGIPLGDAEKWNRAKYYTVNLSPHSQQMRQCFDYILQILKGNLRVGKGYNKCKIGFFLEGSRELPHLVINFSNGATFTARPTAGDKADSIQGSGYNYISYDECCISNCLREEVSVKILPRLLDAGGSLDLVSTPDRTSPSLLEFEDFYRAGLEKKPGYYSLSGSQLDNPYLDKKEIERTTEVQDESGDVEQTRDGKFVFPGTSYFSKDDIENVFNRDKRFKEIKREDNHEYVLGIDLAATEDYTVLIIIDITDENKFKIVYFQRFKGSSVAIPLQLELIRSIVKKYSAISILDASGLGGQMASQLLEGIDPIEFDFKPKSKAEAIGDLRSVITEKKLKSDLIVPLRDELFKYRVEDERIRQDCVMALALAVHGALQYAPPPDPIDNVVTL